MDEQRRAFHFPASYIVAYSPGKVWRALLGSLMTLRATLGGGSEVRDALVVPGCGEVANKWREMRSLEEDGTSDVRSEDKIGKATDVS